MGGRGPRGQTEGAILRICRITSHSVAEEVRREFTGTFSESTTNYFVSGGAAIVLRLLLAISGVKQR